MAIRDEIAWRSGVVYVALALLAVAIIARVFVLQVVERSKWTKMSEQYVFKPFPTTAVRGDILADDGRLLAGDVPYYTVHMDPLSTGMSSKTWSDGIDSLCKGFERILGGQAEVWKTTLTDARKRGNKYLLIRRGIGYETLAKLKKLPIFREGQHKGGMIVDDENRRIRPHNELAARTIGYLNLGEEGNSVGVEGAFDNELAGKNGITIKQKLVGGDWIPVDEPGSIDSENGNDVITTINIDLQDVASTALATQLRRYNAHHGCAVLMDVKTGDIKAIANLGLGGDGVYREIYNYAIRESAEPGSTFKLPALMAALEDGVIDTGDIVDTGSGSVRYYDHTIRDTKEDGYGKISVKKVFENSSNVGMSKIINECYKNKPKDFIDRLYAMGLNSKLGLQIEGEGPPFIGYPGVSPWSGISLPMMSHGYEVLLTPIQTLAFYNAVANDGKMVKPRFVAAIERNGVVIKRFESEVIINSIASKATIEKAKSMMEGVVENGTAVNLKNPNYKIAGKTGTAQIAKNNRGYRQGGVSYQASFVGYFPAENPLYSCIVVVNAPSSGVYYGNIVAGTIFKEISDRVFATRFYKDYKSENKDNAKPVAPEVGNGFGDDINEVLSGFDVRIRKTSKEQWVTTRESGDTITLTPVNINTGLVPDVRGMSLRDAVYLLESYGLRVKCNGKGKVLRQSPEHGARFPAGALVTLEMNM
ncbi:MAG: transpeptidase family protein [Bacteroidales bacterium]|jgi:cell division protein FtsI (penicillin-binding protein 3)|nr:transpeptidase family protein [Bacteroidales bacterium]